jgi:competence protein ComEC
MLRPTLSLACGVIVQWYSPLSLFCSATIAASGLLLWLLIFFAAGPLHRWITPLSLLCSGSLFFAAGSWLCINADIRHDPQWLGYVTDTSNTWEYCVEESPVEKKKNLTMVATVQARYHHSMRIPQRGKILVYLSMDKQTLLLRPGDTIRSTLPPRLIASPRNPGERNWQQVYFMRGITHRLYLRAADYDIIPGKASFVFQRELSVLRKKILNVLKHYISDPVAAGLAQALLIGYRQELDPALSRSYSNAGVIHIIAISGMHLALIGGLLSWCLRPLSRWGPLQRSAQLLVLSALWLFSWLAGSAPSLLRATLLFSSVALGEVLQRRGNSLNTLMVAAFLLIVYNPFWLWDLGFQLSFAAVAGILLIGNYLSKRLSHAKPWWHAIGQLMAISIAAQLLTTPLSLYHFHQFPGAFLLGNLIAIPLSNLILIASVLLVALSPFSGPALLIGKGISLLIGIMNHYVRWVEHIPGLLLTDLQWELPETILLFLFFLTAMHWIANRSRWGRLLTLLCGLALIYCQARLRYRKSVQQHIIVYQLPDATAIDWVAGTNCHSLVDSGRTRDPGQLQYILRQARQLLGVRHTASLPLGQQLQLGEKRIWLADKQRTPPAPDSTLIDLLIVNRHSPFSGEQWILQRKIGVVIIDGSTGTRTREQWLALIDRAGIAVHDTRTAGAFVSSVR